MAKRRKRCEDEQILTTPEAEERWPAQRRLVLIWIAETIKRMGFPRVDGEERHDDDGEPAHRVGSGGARTPSLSAVRGALLDDDDLQDSILTEVHAAYMRNVAAGHVYADDDADGWLYRVTLRTTWRLAEPRGEALLRSALPLPNGDLVEPEQDRDANGHWSGSPEEHAERREFLRRLESALRSLTEADLLLLEASMGERSYREVAELIHTDEANARLRALRLRARLRALLAPGGRKVGRHGGTSKPRPLVKASPRSPAPTSP